MKTKKYLKIASLVVVAAIFIWTFVFLYQKSQPQVKVYETIVPEIADLENKLSSVRRYFNSATKEYNNAVETFPSNILAGMFGFRKEVMFDLGEQRAALEEAPKIKF